MSESHERGAPDDQVPGGEIQDENKDTVSYETFQRVLKESKSVKAKLREAEERIRSLDEVRSSKGDPDSQKKAYEAERAKLQSMAEMLVTKSVRQDFESVARRLGCVDPSVLSTVVDLSQFSVDQDSLKADEQQMEIVVKDELRRRPYLFSSEKKNVPPMNPGNTNYRDSGKSLGEMTMAELESEYKKLSIKP